MMDDPVIGYADSRLRVTVICPSCHGFAVTTSDPKSDPNPVCAMCHGTGVLSGVMSDPHEIQLMWYALAEDAFQCHDNNPPPPMGIDDDGELWAKWTAQHEKLLDMRDRAHAATFSVPVLTGKDATVTP